MLLSFLNLVIPRPLAAQEAMITDFTVSNSDTHLLLYLTVTDCFTEEMETGLHNGIPATFTYYVELYKTRKTWPDRKLASHVFYRTLTYDNLKEEYSIISSTNNKIATTQLLSQAKTLMAEVTDFKAVDINQLEANASYKLQVKVKLARKTLPLYFHYLIPFSSLWDFETDWRTLSFIF
jgi:hypothetical protein